MGALDKFGDRVAILDALDCILSVSASHSRAKEAGQISLFSASPCGPMETITLAAPKPVPHRTMLAWEKELLGLYVSDHPLAAYREELEAVVTHWSAALAEAPNQSKVRVAGMVTHIRAFQSRNGKAMAFATIEDLQGSIELILFPSVWEKAAALVKVDAILVAEGKAESGNGTPRVLVDSVTDDLKKAAKKASKSGLPGMSHAAAAPAPAAPPVPADEDWYPLPEDPGEDLAMTMEPPPAAAAVAPIAIPNAGLPMAAAGARPASVPADPPTGQTGPPAVVIVSPAPEPLSPIAAAGPMTIAEINPMPIAAIGARSPIAPADPIANTAPAKIEGPRLILLYIRETGDRARDTRRLRILYGLLTSYPGTDHFAFHISEAERTYRLEFPTNTTSWTAELERQILHLVGAGCVEIQPLTVQ